jgi:quercetin dioxygenase-like cupin family protein
MMLPKKPGAKTASILVAMLAVAVAAAAVAAQDGQKRLGPSEIPWPSGASSLVGTSGVPGIQTVTLKGDPSKPGLYTMLLRVGPNTKIQAHSHPDDRTAVVVSGTWYFGYGREFSEGGLKELPAGSYYTEPPGVNHFAMTKGEGVTIAISGVGPSGTSYVDPRNDPTRR